MICRILLVDDEPQVTESIKRSLHREEYLVMCANSAQEALAVLAREKIDVVISDEMMPGMLGTDLLSIISGEYPGTIRIMLTGHPDLDTALRAVNMGHIYRFLIKPCSGPELRLTIRQALQYRELTRKSLSLLQTVKQQNAVLEELETRHPGITHVRRDDEGAIYLHDMEYDFDSLIEEINTEVKKSDTRAGFAAKAETTRQ